MKLKKAFLSLLGIISPIVGNSVNFNSNMQMLCDPTNIAESSHLRFCGNLYDSFLDGSKSWVCSNRIFISPTAVPTFSSSLGIRHIYKDHAIGHFGFVNFTNQFNRFIYQPGVSVDCVHPLYEVRMNYYHPKKFNFYDSEFSLYAHQKIEAEAIVKVKGMHFGSGPVYNFTHNTIGSHVRVAIPFKYFSVGAQLLKHQNEPVRLGLSTTFNFYGAESDDPLFAPSIYSHAPSYCLQYKKEKPQKKHEEKRDEIAPEITPEIINYDIATEDPIPKQKESPPPKDSGWFSGLYDWFWPEPKIIPAKSYLNPMLVKDRLPFEWESAPGVDIPEDQLCDFVLSSKRFHIEKWKSELNGNDILNKNKK